MFKISLLLLSLNLFLYGSTVNASADPLSIPVYMMTTRGNDPSSPIKMQQGPGYNGNYQYGDLNKLLESCPPEIVIFIHGWGVSPAGAIEQLDRVKTSLERNGYNTSLIGYSWGSDRGWEPAKVLARNEGTNLAQFISNYKDTCKNIHNVNSEVKLVSHSLGARVILSALESLHHNSTWNNVSNNFTVASVILMGAAVDDEEVSTNPSDTSADSTNLDSVKFAYGKAIQDEVAKFYNLNNPEDNALQPLPFAPVDWFYQIYPFFEKDSALGQNGFQAAPGITLPNNFFQVNVKDELMVIHNADAIDGWDVGLCNQFGYCQVNVGDNHLGYRGFRNLTDTNKLMDDGAMSTVINLWQSR
jgi:hypothetical protein